MLESVKVLRCNEDEKPEQNHGRDVRAHAGAILDGAAILFEFREIEHAQNIVGLRIINSMSAVSGSLSKRDDVLLVALLTGPHLAPQTTICVAIKMSMIRPHLRSAFVKILDRWRNLA
ncbi:hypothetical protein [Bradyrhizobium sp. LTSP849]|uniref:hypothetical protein n=1 Tax=Bradyrhizobium sp. LTSP849 TaxID=1615890 RepID=UPI0012E00E27|nr:hypothetical protein [Bradyrhizobium sp. LTSP849]